MQGWVRRKPFDWKFAAVDDLANRMRRTASAQDIMIAREVGIPSERGCSQGHSYRLSMRRQNRARRKHDDARLDRSREQDGNGAKQLSTRLYRQLTPRTWASATIRPFTESTSVEVDSSAEKMPKSS